MCSEHCTLLPVGANHECGTHSQWLHTGCNSTTINHFGCQVIVSYVTPCHSSHYDELGDQPIMTWAIKCWDCDEVVFHLEVHEFPGQITHHQSACHVNHHHLHYCLLAGLIPQFSIRHHQNWLVSVQMLLLQNKMCIMQVVLLKSKGLTWGHNFGESLIAHWGSNLALHICFHCFEIRTNSIVEPLHFEMMLCQLNVFTFYVFDQL